MMVTRSRDQKGGRDNNNRPAINPPTANPDFINNDNDVLSPPVQVNSKQGTIHGDDANVIHIISDDATPPPPTDPNQNTSRGSAGVFQIVDVDFDTITSLMTHLQKIQTEALKNILDSVLNRQAHSSTPVSSFIDPTMGTLARCKASFGGGPDESIEAFIDAVESYCECTQVPDSNIIRGLSMLLCKEAGTWWHGLKHTITSWAQAKENLISAYGDRRPPYRVYLDIFASPQNTENTDMFVARTRALLAKLPRGDISQKAELDITYGLLHARIRERLRREEFTSFSELLQRARAIEDSLNEKEATMLREFTVPDRPVITAFHPANTSRKLANRGESNASTNFAQDSRETSA